MEYLPNPIDVKEFDRCFRIRRHLGEEFQFVGFYQTETRWTATYQDDALSVSFSGRMERARGWIQDAES